MLQRLHVLLSLFQGLEHKLIPNDRISTLFQPIPESLVHTRKVTSDLGSLAGPTGQQLGPLLAAGFWTEGLLYGSNPGQLRYLVMISTKG